MGHADAVDVWTRSNRAVYELLAPASPGASVTAVTDGVRAAVTPAAPRRSLLNAVHAVDGDALASAMDELRELYARARVDAFRVWIAPGDDALAAACERLGGTLEGSAEVMHARIAGLDLTPRAEVSLAENARLDDAMVLNDAAYPGVDGFSGVYTSRAGAAMRWVVADVGGVHAGCVCWAVIGGDAYVAFVATAPEFRGRGIASELMRRALAAAAKDGAQTTTLEATVEGAPIYARLGYVSAGPCSRYVWNVTPGL